MILKNGEIKAEWPHSLTYVKFIQTCLALLLNLTVLGFLNNVQIKRTLSKALVFVEATSVSVFKFPYEDSIIYNVGTWVFGKL